MAALDSSALVTARLAADLERLTLLSEARVRFEIRKLPSSVVYVVAEARAGRRGFGFAVWRRIGTGRIKGLTPDLSVLIEPKGRLPAAVIYDVERKDIDLRACYRTLTGQSERDIGLEIMSTSGFEGLYRDWIAARLLRGELVDVLRAVLEIRGSRGT